MSEIVCCYVNEVMQNVGVVLFCLYVYISGLVCVLEMKHSTGSKCDTVMYSKVMSDNLWVV